MSSDDHSAKHSIADEWVSRRGILILSILFFCLCFPMLGSLSHWRADERFYTDATIRMLQTGDYLSPTYDDGRLRFKKPILDYWAILVSWKSLGISYTTARLPGLLAGTATVWLTFELALLLHRRSRDALIAAAIMASNMTVMLLSTRSTPDILLCLFSTTSMLGFTGLILQRKLTPAYYSLAYVGAALAITTKGLAGLLPVVYAFLYVALAKPSGLRPRQLLHAGIMLGALAIPAAWFALVIWKHGSFTVMDLFDDQIGRRLTGSKLYIPANAGHYLGSIASHFLPWSLLVVIALTEDFQKVRDRFMEHRREVCFAAGWVLLLVVIFTCGNQMRTRYLLPAYPQVALLFALAIGTGIRKDALSKAMAPAVPALYALGLGTGVILMLVAPLLSLPLTAAGLLIALTSLILASMTRRWAAAHKLVALGIGLLLIMVVVSRGVMGVFFVSPASTIVDRVQRWNPDCTLLPTAGVHSNYICQIRIVSGGRIEPRMIRKDQCHEALAEAGALVCSEAILRQVNFPDCRIEPCGQSGREWNRWDVLAFLNPRTREAALAARRETYHLVTRPSGARPIQVKPTPFALD